MPSYVKFETPKELIPQILEMLSVAKDSGKVKKGVNETTKSIERKLAQFVVVAEDVQPEEVVVHIPVLCEENGISYAFVPAKKELGHAVGIGVGTSAVAVENAGGASESLQGILKKLPRSEAAAPKEEAQKVVAKPKTAAKPAKPKEKPAKKSKEKAEAKPKTESEENP